MVRLCAGLMFLPALALAELSHWCEGMAMGDVQLQDDADVEVIWAQAALFSANNGSTILGNFGLFHTAVVFKQGDLAWTLEFDNSATNMETSPSGAGYYPVIDEVEAALSWDYNAARWCLTTGVLHTVDHWKQSYKTIATISPSRFQSIFTDLVEPTNSSDSTAPPFYNMWHIWTRTPQDLEFVPDITCASGAIWIRDYLVSHGFNITEDLKATRIHIPVDSVSRVGPSDSEWPDVITFYKGLRQVFAGSGNMIDKFLSLLNTLPLSYAFDGNNATHPYLKLEGQRFLPDNSYEKIPLGLPIPGPNGLIPAPPTPPPPPVASGDFYGKPDAYNQCQPGENLFQVLISGGGLAKVCTPQCSGGNPDGVCPASDYGWWEVPNCDNQDPMIPLADCLIRCGPIPFLCAAGQDCFGLSGFLGICMYTFDEDFNTNNTEGYRYVTRWNESQSSVALTV